MTLPTSLRSVLDLEIQRLFGESVTLHASAPVGGGDINEAARLTLGDGSQVFLKHNPSPLPELFSVEAKGLEELKRADALRVPDVYAVGDATDDHPAYILMEWIPETGHRDPGSMRTFGRGLAGLHRTISESYGLDHDNYIGSLPQRNAQSKRWADFYRDQRLGAQCRMAQERGRLTAERGDRLERLMARLEDFFPDEDEISPSLLHGDLWGGNHIVTDDGVALIDPAVYYGHREMDLAFTELFGGFPSAFYEGYDEVWPLESGYRDRKALYQLYPLMVHLNLFGEAYGGRVDRILTRYVG